ncbi:LysR family transcriptional regulator [Candidimonas humi]|uniref:LysR substrate-binding domain-containing protein n=1 Tax=Candidimonas humi TaxID=683355 RepID=A0ABV8P056_9BURK|nr:LysR substrate-binding domain-containing protein [Candidimonas humi]MBV6305578.1 LysR family transcriptional regulator [Candidimonas humi]
MNPHFPPLNPLRVFECVARHRSFTAAARELHITQGAVSHQIRALENWLGFKLFERQGSQLRLSQGAAAYARALGSAFSGIVTATQEFASTGSQQVLEVRGHTTFFTHWLIPLLPGFQKAHPDIKVRLAANVEWMAFEHDEAGVGIRYGDGDWDGLHSELLFSDELTPVMAPGLAQRLPRPCTLKALLALPLLHSNRRPGHWADWIGAAHGKRAFSASDMYCEDLSIIYECAIQGLGVALGQLRYLKNEFAQGKLVAPHPFVLRRPRGYHLVCPRSQAEDAKIACFRQWLLAQV